MKQINCEFFMDKENVANALQSLQKEYEHDIEIPYRDDVFNSIEDAFSFFNWDHVEKDGDGNIVSIQYSLPVYVEVSFNAMNVIAEFVKPGSHIDFVEEEVDGIWAVYFDGKKASRYYADYFFDFEKDNQSEKTNLVLSVLESLSTSELVDLWNVFCEKTTNNKQKIFAIEELDKKMGGLLPSKVALMLACCGIDYDGKSNINYFSFPDEFQFFSAEKARREIVKDCGKAIAEYCVSKKDALENEKIKNVLN